MRSFFAGLLLAAAVAAPSYAEPPMWVVKDKDSEVVLFGSVHVLPPGLKWRPAALDAALTKADDLWFELPVDPASEQEVARLAATLGVMAPGQSLYAMLPKADAERMMKVAKAYDLDPAALDRFEPWLAEVALAGAAYRKIGADGAYGVEATVSRAAPATVQRRAFETPAEQMDIFDKSPLDEQIASLRQTIKDLDEDPDAFRRLIDAWMKADVKGLDHEALEPLRKASPAGYRRLVADRNAHWAAALDARLKGHGRTVVVVGVGHLVGRGSLPERLRALGYSVTGP